ncbi:MAG: hypothetical protein IKN43_07065 [Selenomonadaceae bacterium]|nr:hypothetical protein [Selenomonadaceae bacterium]
MKYITGVYALNLTCTLDTQGDWHQSSLNWEMPDIRETKNSFFGDYGIEENCSVPMRKGEACKTANHIRAILDLLEDRNFPVLQGMRDCYIDNDKYDKEIFEKIYKMKNLPYWREIKDFVGKEYMMKWVNFLKGKEYSHNGI